MTTPNVSPLMPRLEQSFELLMGLGVGLASPLAGVLALLTLGSTELDVRQVGDRLATWGGPAGDGTWITEESVLVLLPSVAPEPNPSVDGAGSTPSAEPGPIEHGVGLPDVPGALDSSLALASRAAEDSPEGEPWGQVDHGIQTAAAGGGVAGHPVVDSAESSSSDPGPARPFPPAHSVLDAAATMRFVAVAEGGFWMGSRAEELGRFDNEGPRHQVTVGSFWMAATEVTQVQWRAVMGELPAVGPSGSSLPVVGVSWCDALRFANALSVREGLRSAYRFQGLCGFGGTVRWDEGADGYRLPSEAEWEFAARGGQEARYAGGGELDALGWHVGNSGGQPRPVAGLAPNPLGLHDMSGNVWEWVWDWLGDYPAEQVRDPRGPDRGRSRILRGGSWSYASRFHRVADRNWSRPGYRSPAVGFRLARTLNPGDLDALVVED